MTNKKIKKIKGLMKGLQQTLTDEISLMFEQIHFKGELQIQTVVTSLYRALFSVYFLGSVQEKK